MIYTSFDKFWYIVKCQRWKIGGENLVKKAEKKKSIASIYRERYDIKDDENEEKRVRRFIRKLHQDKLIFSDFPFDYMVEEEQMLFLNYLMFLMKVLYRI